MASPFSAAWWPHNADEAVEQAKRLAHDTGTKWWVVKARSTPGAAERAAG